MTGKLDRLEEQGFIKRTPAAALAQRLGGIAS
jgi:hypothetical protein